MARRIIENEGALKASTAMHPLGRIGQPREVAKAIAFLLGTESAWTTGQVLGVDGGLSRVKTSNGVQTEDSGLHIGVRNKNAGGVWVRNGPTQEHQESIIKKYNS